MQLIKRLFKIILWLVVIVAILAAVGAFALVKWVNPNHFKPQIITAVDAATGRHLTLSGDLSWTFFPNIGIHMGAAALSNPPAFTQVNFAEINSANLLLSWPALLHGNIAVSSLNIDGLQVFLRQKGTQNNWTFTSPASKPAVSAHSSASTGQSVGFSVAALNLTNASLTYDNDQTKTHFAANNVNLSLTQLTPGTSFLVDLSGNIKANDSLSGPIKLSTRCIYNLQTNSFSLGNLALQSNFTYLNNADQAIHLSSQISGQINANLNQKTVTLSNLNFALNQVLNGTLNLQLQSFTAPAYTGNLSISPFSVPDLASSLGMPLPRLPNQNVLQQLSLSTRFAGNTHQIAFNPLQVHFANTQIQGAVNLSSFQPLRVNEHLTADQLDAADFVDLSGAKLPMQNIALSGSASFARSLSLNQNLSVGQITLQGFDLAALINGVNQIVTNLLSVRNLMDATSQINAALKTLQQSQGSLNANNGKQTDLGSLKANVVVNNQGILTTPVFLLKGPLVQVTGSGQANLNQKTIDYTLVSRLVSPGKIQGLTIPYQIQGTFSQPKTGVEWVAVQAQILKYLSVALTSTVTHSVGNVVNGAVQALQGLFNRP